jgi:hypothetical protein
MKNLSLKDFITQSINEITDGVVEAQKHAKDVNGIVNPYIGGTIGDVKYAAEHQDEISSYHPVTTLDFDIAVTVVEDDKAQAGVGIFAAAFGVGAKGETTDRSETVSRIKFQVNTVLPDQR